MLRAPNNCKCEFLQITGGRLNHTTSVRFTDANGTANELVVTQRYNGLNIWDQLDVNIEVNGNLPEVAPDASISYADALDTYVFQGDNRIVSDGSGAIQVNDENITFVINQVVSTTWSRQLSIYP